MCATVCCPEIINKLIDTTIGQLVSHWESRINKYLSCFLKYPDDWSKLGFFSLWVMEIRRQSLCKKYYI